MHIAILGRQSGISLAELEALYGADSISPVENYAALVDCKEPLPQPRLGGTMKSATVITRLQNSDANQAFTHIQNIIVAYTDEKVFEGKIQLGFSLYGFRAQKNWLLKKTLEVKKVLKKSGRSVRIIENKAEALEAAQILYNKLTGPQGIELLIIKDGPDVILAQTTAVQDIDAYAERDFGRPMRDAFVGMLPPKLAQVMINLAKPEPHATILDPFCGTGVVLQEALLMQHSVYGSDLSEKMIRYTRENINWLQEKNHTTAQWYLEEADATNHTWRKPVDSVVCETYLGTPLSSLPDHTKLVKIMNEANDIAEAFLRNLANQIAAGTRICVALPAWYAPHAPSLRTDSPFLHLKMLDHLSDLGYNRLEFVHASKSELIYHREDQIVARELTILEKN
jgi:tRNA (guanine10-N2)-dimethyltransferase